MKWRSAQAFDHERGADWCAGGDEIFRCTWAWQDGWTNATYFHTRRSAVLVRATREESHGLMAVTARTVVADEREDADAPRVKQWFVAPRAANAATAR